MNEYYIIEGKSTRFTRVADVPKAPKLVGYWILNPLETSMGPTRFGSIKKPRLLVRIMARLFFDCVWRGGEP